MAVPTFQAAGTAVGSINAISVAWPTHLADDIGILVVEISGNNSLTTPSGWEPVGASNDVATTAGSRLGVYWRRATSSSESNASVADSGNHTLGQIYTFRGCVKTETPIDSCFCGAKTTASTTATVPAVTTQSANELIVMCVGRPNDSASTTEFSSPTNASLSSLTERGEAGTTDGNGGGFGVFTGVLSTAGSSGSTTITKATSTTDTYVSFALREQSIDVVLNTADANVFTTDKPTLEFTGTDYGDGNTLEYFTQISTSATFGTTSTVASFTDAENGTNYLGPGATIIGECFQCTSTIQLESVDFIISRQNPDPSFVSGVMYAKIYAMTGTFGTSGVPTGSAIAISNPYDAGSIPSSSNVARTFTFPPESQITLSASTYYCVSVETTTGDSLGYFRVQGKISTGASYAGNKFSWTGASWSATSTQDLYFTVTGITPDLEISTLSETDAGFADVTNPADTHPFASGDTISYTVQTGSELADGTYYWRASAEAPGGDDIFCKWTPARSFTVSAATSSISTVNSAVYSTSVSSFNSLSKSSISSINQLA